MKKVLLTWAVCMFVTGMFIFSGCAFIKVKGKTFVFESARVDYAGSGEPNLSVLENERINLINKFKNFKLNFSDLGQVELPNNVAYYYQDGNEINLFTNEDRTVRLETGNHLQLAVQQDKVVLKYYGADGTQTNGFVYIVFFSELEK